MLATGKEDPWSPGTDAPMLSFRLFVKHMASPLGGDVAAPALAITTAFHLLEKKRDGEVPFPWRTFPGNDTFSLFGDNRSSWLATI